MAEQVFKFPSVQATERDLSAPTTPGAIEGIPAGIIGTSTQGPAFVPITVGSIEAFIQRFGPVDQKHFGTLAARAWMRNQSALTYVRVLGSGDGKARLSTADEASETPVGGVKHAGFVVGSQICQPSGKVEKNKSSQEPNGLLGRTYFLGCFMSESHSRVFSSAGIQQAANKAATFVLDANGCRDDAITQETIIEVPVHCIPGNVAQTYQDGHADSALPSGSLKIKIIQNSTHGNLEELVYSAEEDGFAAIGMENNTTAAQNATDLAAVFNGAVHALGPTPAGAAEAGPGTGRVFVGRTFVNTGVGDGLFTAAAASPGAGQVTLTVNHTTNGTRGNSIFGYGQMVSRRTGVAGADHFTGGTGGAVPIVRGVLMVPSGVVPSLSCSFHSSAASTVQKAKATYYDLGTSAGTKTGNLYGTDLIPGAPVGQVNSSVDGNASFRLFLNGHGEEGEQNKREIDLDFNPLSSNYIGAVLNTDPAKIEEEGHLLYSHYDVYDNEAVVTGSGVVPDWSWNLHGSNQRASNEHIAFLLSGSGGRDTSTSYLPNFENFRDRFRHASTPTIVSQRFGGTTGVDLFRVHSLDDGELPGRTFKVAISNVKASTDPANEYGTFDLKLLGIQSPPSLHNSPANPTQTFYSATGLTLNPDDENYIGKIIGTQHTRYDFDQETGSQRIVVDGLYGNTNPYIRVEISDAVEDKEISATAVPVGFRGVYHLVTSGSAILGNPIPLSGMAMASAEVARIGKFAAQGELSVLSASHVAGSGSLSAHTTAGMLQFAQQPPFPLRESIFNGTSGSNANIKIQKERYWGALYENMENQDRGSSTNPDRDEGLPGTYTNSGGIGTTFPLGGVHSWSRYFPLFDGDGQQAWVGENPGEQDLNGTIYNSDRFCNNGFTLENIEVVVDSNNVIEQNTIQNANKAGWSLARYRRDGVIPTLHSDNSKRRFLDPTVDLVTENLPYLQFLVPFQGGFDGTNKFVREMDSLSTTQAYREQNTDKTNLGGIESGPTINAYRQAVNIMSEKANTSISLLALPGIRAEEITTYTLRKVEDRFDAFYIMDINQYDVGDELLSGSLTSDNIYVPKTNGISDVHVRNTVTKFSQRNLDSSFGAAYFPDVSLKLDGAAGTVVDPAQGTIDNPDAQMVDCPPSVAILGAFGLNDRIGAPWFAPAGFTRGRSQGALEEFTQLNDSNVERLYGARINPIYRPGNASGPVVYGQKTLLRAQNALDRINVRRLLIDIRRKVRVASNDILFEQNRESTLAKFSKMCNDILGPVQLGQGIERFRVVIDSSTTTQADIENNTIRGKIFVQPTSSVEFISLDFVVTNQGAEGL